MRVAYNGNDRVPIDEYDMYLSRCMEEGVEPHLTCAEGHHVIARRGEKNVHHYAHKANTVCSCGDNKGTWHIWWQNRVRSDAQEVRIESTRIDGSRLLHIADTLVPKSMLYVPVQHMGYVIEYQHSPMTTDVMRQREFFYTAHGYHLVWIFDTCTWDIQVVRRSSNDDIVIRKRRGSSFPMDAAFGTSTVTKILDFGKTDLLIVHRQNGNTIHGKIISIEEFDRIYMGMCTIEDPDIRPFHHHI